MSDSESAPSRHNKNVNSTPFRASTPEQTPSKGKGASGREADQDVLHALRRKLSRLAKLTDEVLFKRYAAAHAQATLDSSQAFLQQNLAILIAAIGPVIASAGESSGGQTLSEQHEIVLKDFGAVQTQTSKLKEQREELGELESALKDRQVRLVAFLKKFEERLRGKDAADLGSTFDISLESPEDTEVSSREPMPDLVKQYYSKKGDISILLERLQYAEDEHQEEAFKREFIADRGDQLELSEGDFIERYRLRRQGFLDEIERAKGEAAVLAKECEDAGYDIILGRGHVNYSESSSNTGLFVTEDYSVHSSSDLNIPRPFSPAPPSSNIHRWLEQLSDRSEPPNLTSDENLPLMQLSASLKPFDAARSSHVPTSSASVRRPSFDISPPNQDYFVPNMMRRHSWR